MKIHLLLTITFLALFTACLGPATDTEEKSEKHAYTNHLIHENSPYLLQHAHNPVNWYPWGEEALQKAQAENKLLIISIGYAACHWCHVMEHESFEDTTVARIMNENFIAIKVDREERPDVDDVYMTACQLSNQGSCGWPLNAFALPDGRPVWAGTYFPKDEWLKILDYFSKEFRENPQKMQEFADQLTNHIRQIDQLPVLEEQNDLTAEELSAVALKFMNSIDPQYGGRKSSGNKFPMPNNYEFLLRYHALSGNAEARNLTLLTLDRMRRGGIYDQLGGGFARYSTDPEWRVPHFEKMLYDNGQLVSLYAKAYQLTQNEKWANVVNQTLAFIAREMTSPEGGFYSSLDADSEGEEGKFYVWTQSQIDSLLTDPQLNRLFCDFYDISPKGNWEHGKNILYIQQDEEAFAKRHNMSTEELLQHLAKARKILFDARNQRPKPRLDDKILTAWNALMLQGYVDAYKALGKETYREAALKNARFLLDNMLQNDGRLLRNYKDGHAKIDAFLDDYVLLAQALMSLYEITFDEQWLFHAEKLLQYAQQHFNDPNNPLCYYTPDNSQSLVARKKEITDNVIPASNSSLARALNRLNEFLYRPELGKQAHEMLQVVWPQIRDAEQPSFYSNWLQTALEHVWQPYEIAITGEQAPTLALQLQKRFLPSAVVLAGTSEGQLELLKDRLIEGETMIYVCQNGVCKLPVTSLEEALKLMAY